MPKHSLRDSSATDQPDSCVLTILDRAKNAIVVISTQRTRVIVAPAESGSLPGHHFWYVDHENP
eukprot:1576108-Pyramimonas_sp.AAC.1